MPLPDNLDSKILRRFDQLIDEAEELLAECNTYDQNHAFRYWEWVVKTGDLITMIFGDSQQGAKYQQTFEHDSPIGYVSGNPREWFLLSDFRRKVARLRGIRDSYVNGIYVSLENQLIVSVSADYMAQAEALLGEGISGQYDHVPAAVLSGAVLEDALRRLCQRHTPPIEITKLNGDKKMMDSLIQELQRAKIINKLEGDQLRAWAKIRNYAAHGEFDKFERPDVNGMLSGVRHFLTKHL